MSLAKSQQLFADDIVRLLLFIESKDYSFTFGDAYRAPELAEIYAKEGKGIVDSLHCKRLALDINLFDKNGMFLSETKDHEQFGIFWESLYPANRWGGKFKRVDGNHYERNEPNGI